MTIETVKWKKNKKTSPQIILLEPGQRMALPLSKRPYIDSLKSGAYKYRFPERVYSTYVDTENPKQVFIERDEDNA